MVEYTYKKSFSQRFWKKERTHKAATEKETLSSPSKYSTVGKQICLKFTEASERSKAKAVKQKSHKATSKVNHMWHWFYQTQTETL